MTAIEYEDATLQIETAPATDLCTDQPQAFVAPASIRPLLQGDYDLEVWFTDTNAGA